MNCHTDDVQRQDPMSGQVFHHRTGDTHHRRSWKDIDPGISCKRCGLSLTGRLLDGKRLYVELAANLFSSSRIAKSRTLPRCLLHELTDQPVKRKQADTNGAQPTINACAAVRSNKYELNRKSRLVGTRQTKMSADNPTSVVSKFKLACPTTANWPPPHSRISPAFPLPA